MPLVKNRNHMCRLREMDCQGVRQILMENELLRVTVLAGKGCDITEILYKPMDLDFLWHSFTPVQDPRNFAPSRLPAAGTFLPLYEGGWQVLFPNYGAPCTYKGAEYGLHGEFCAVPWEYEITADKEEEICVHLWARTASTPYLMERWLTLKTGEPHLHIRERVSNESPVQMECMWGQHPVVGQPFLDESCEILVSGPAEAVTLRGAGILPDEHSSRWPLMVDQNGKEQNLSKVHPPKSGGYREYGLKGLDLGQCTVWNHNRNIGFRLQWELERFPYLWIWEPNGANLSHPWYGRNYCLGVEPWSHLSTNLEDVVAQNAALTLAPWSSLETEITVGACLERGDA